MVNLSLKSVDGDKIISANFEPIIKFLEPFGANFDFKVWNEELTDEDLKAYADCTRKDLKGSLFSWEDTDWKLLNTANYSELVAVDMANEVCWRNNYTFLLLPVPMQYHGYGQAEDSCEKFSGKVANYVTKEDYEWSSTFLLRYHDHPTSCHSKEGNFTALTFWWGATDDLEEGTFRNRYTDQVLEYMPWMPGSPYPDATSYNCLNGLQFVKSGTSQQILAGSKVRDEPCEGRLYCNLCLSRKNLIIKVRGLCGGSHFDRSYKLSIDQNNLPVYLGETSSSISFDKENEQWIWQDRIRNESIATSPALLQSFLLGSTFIKFHSKSDVCISGKSYQSLPIKLTTCGENDYTCNNGKCIPSDNRCDQARNCDDGSDEENCQLVQMRKNYNKKLAPLSWDQKVVYPVSINVSVILEKVLQISESDQEYDLKFTLILEWYDNRLNYYNLKYNQFSNAVSNEDISRLWIPSIIFRNTRENDIVKADDDVVVTVAREGNFTRSKNDIAEEINIFKGSENRIVFESSYTKSFSCEYQLQMYPFDLQVCTINLEIRKLEKSSVLLFPKEIKMLGQKVLTQYTLMNWKMKPTNSSDYSEGVVVTISMKRRLMNEILTTYLPSFIILVIIYSTNFFKPFFFEAVVTVNLTSLLVLTTLFISVSSSLLKTSYVKASYILVTINILY